MTGPSQHVAAPRSRWWVVFVTGILTVVCGTIGFVQHGMAEHPGGHLTLWIFLDAVYAAIEMLVLHSPEFTTDSNGWMEVGRWLGVLTFLATTWFLLVNRLRQEIRLLRMGFWTEHYVICGLSQKGMAIIESIKGRDAGARIVALDPEPAAEFAERCNHLKVCLVKQEATEAKGLKSARVGHASQIIAVNVKDEVNIRVAAEVREFRDGLQAAPAFCRAHIANSHLPDALQKWTDASEDPHTTLRFFDVFDSEARRVLLNASLPGVSRKKQGGMAPLDGPGVRAKEARGVHVVILGLGRMGSALLVRAAKMGQFANGKKLRISVIDREAQTQHEQLLFRYPILAQPNEVCDLKMYQLQADSLEVRQFIEQCAGESETILHVFVCLDNNARAVEIGLRLWEMMAEHPHSYVNVRITSKASVAPILEAAGARIQAFGMLEDTCTEETVLGERIEALARAIHEEFVTARQGDTKRAAAGDPALVDWEHLREDFRESNRQQADHMGIKMRAIGCRIVEASAPGETVAAFTAEEVEMLARLEHRRWNAERWLSGWRYGKVTDKAKRVHRCLVPWEELTEEIKGYDRETVQKLPKWLAGAKPAMKVVRG